MLFVVTLALVAFVSAKPTHGPLGVEVKEAGKMRIGVDGSTLQIVGDGKCTNKFVIWYPVSQVTGGSLFKREGYCPCYVAPDDYLNCESSCPLKLNDDGSMEIDVDEAPKGCTVTMKNAFLAPKEITKDEQDNSWIVYVAIFVPIGVILLLLAFGVAFWFCLRPRWLRAKAARNAARAQKTAVGAEMDDESAAMPALVAVPSNAAISSVPATSGVTPVATALIPAVSSTAPSTQPPTTSTTPEPLNAAAPKPPPPSMPPVPKPIVQPTSSATPVPPFAPTPIKLVVSEAPKPTPKAPSNLMPIDQRPVHNIKKPVVVTPTSSGSSGRRRRKKLELSTEDFVEPDKLTGAPKPRKEPRKKRKMTTPEPAPLPPPPPLTNEEPPPTYLSEREQRRRGRAEAVVDVLKASAKATADDCCPDDSKRASTEVAKAPPAKRSKENLVKFPLSDSRSRQTASVSRSQEQAEEVKKKARTKEAKKTR